MTSPDLTQANIDKLADLFPSVVTESLGADGTPTRAIDFDLLRQELSDHIVEGPQERYQLDWPGKRAAAFAANAPIAKTLRPVREESVDFDTTRNLFIEGDNLEALKLLQESYLGKVKLIYIDPPYNTGNDFVYEDDFAESSAEYLERSGQKTESGDRLVANTEANGRFHSDWLSMMYPRLKLARNLLADDGLIFISIDDHELHNLRTICSEVFGQSNFVGIITRATGTPTGGGFDGFTNMVDYVLVYRRSDRATINGLEFGDNDAAIYNEQDARGRYLTRSLRRTGGEDRREDRPTMYFPVEAPDGSSVYPVGPGGYESRWICGRERFDEMSRDGLIQWKRVQRPEGETWHPFQKFYLEGRDKRPSNLWTDLEGNKKATRELRDLFDGEKVFDSPKPTALVERIIEVATDRDSLVLDFFAGSGTTAEAVLRLNARDSGARSYILVQLPDPVPTNSGAARFGFNVLSEVSRERLRRGGARTHTGMENHGPALDTGFRSLHVATTNMTDTLATADDLVQIALTESVDSVKPDRTDEDLLFQVLLEWGLDLAEPITVDEASGHRILAVAEDALFACFADDVSADVVRAIAERRPLRAVFKDSGFATDAARINAEQIFRELSPETELRTI
ncbi:site-specific DNA-methyltransferase [Microbacterium sp. RD1]|uniref:site-specific DNA-methyltransferase n=1 Tax=Microbacterium sp. RD1 TaxID=3457313 RepID=UPI003FA5C96A